MDLLTPEDKARIEEEERKRHAEEQYRQEVRSRIQPTPASAPSPPATSNTRKTLQKIFLGALFLLLVTIVISNIKFRANQPPQEELHYVAKTDKIVDDQIVVSHGDSVFYKIIITPVMKNPVVFGKFEARGGSGNDIIGVLTNESGYENWINGHQTKVFWTTEGKQTMGSFNLNLRPGTYYLAFSNKFSAITDKDLTLTASLSYQ